MVGSVARDGRAVVGLLVGFGVAVTVLGPCGQVKADEGWHVGESACAQPLCENPPLAVRPDVTVSGGFGRIQRQGQSWLVVTSWAM